MSPKSGGHRHTPDSIHESGGTLLYLPATLDRFRDAVGSQWRSAQLTVMLEKEQEGGYRLKICAE